MSNNNNNKIKIWTIGHSTRTLDVLVDMCRCFGIQTLVDIRSYPGSRAVPEFNKEFLMRALPDRGIEYRHVVDLGGRRPKQRLPSNIMQSIGGYQHLSVAELNAAWEKAPFKNYADYALSDTFQNALNSLISTASCSRTVIMCSEAVWWRCHRRIVSDCLVAHDVDVYHIMGINKSTLHTRTPFGQVIEHSRTIYPKVKSKNNNDKTEPEPVHAVKRRRRL